MSLHMCVIAIEGDARGAVPDFFLQSQYDLPDEDATLDADGFAAAMEALDEPEDKAVAFHRGWTSILDPEMVLYTEEEALAAFSRDYGKVLAIMVEAGSGTYGLSLYQKGEKRRDLLVTGGALAEDFGEPLPAEEQINLADLDEDAILDLALGLGYNFDTLGEAQFIVYPLLATLDDEEPFDYDGGLVDPEDELDEEAYRAGNAAAASVKLDDEEDDPAGDRTLIMTREDEAKLQGVELDAEDDISGARTIMMTREMEEELEAEDSALRPVEAAPAPKPWWRFW